MSKLFLGTALVVTLAACQHKGANVTPPALDPVVPGIIFGAVACAATGCAF